MLLRRYRRLFKKLMSVEEQRDARSLVEDHEREIDAAKEEARKATDFVHESLSSTDPVTVRAFEDEVKIRKKIAAGKKAVAMANRRRELDAAANGYRFIEVECEDQTNDATHEVISVRLDTEETFASRGMSEVEIASARSRTQTSMSFDAN